MFQQIIRVCGWVSIALCICILFFFIYDIYREIRLIRRQRREYEESRAIAKMNVTMNTTYRLMYVQGEMPRTWQIDTIDCKGDLDEWERLERANMIWFM